MGSDGRPFQGTFWEGAASGGLSHGLSSRFPSESFSGALSETRIRSARRLHWRRPGATLPRFSRLQTECRDGPWNQPRFHGIRECHPSRVAAPGQVFSPCVYLPAGGLHQPTRYSSTTRLSPGKAPSISRGDTHRLKRIYPERPKPVPGTARIRSFTSLRTKARSSRVGAAGKM